MTDLRAKCPDCGEWIDHGPVTASRSVDGTEDVVNLTQALARSTVSALIAHRCVTGPRAAIRAPQLIPGRSRFRH